MSKDNYDLFFEILKEISRQSDEAYNVLENKVSTLIATNAVIISILAGLGVFLIENISSRGYNEVGSAIFFVIFYILTLIFGGSLWNSYKAFQVKRFKILSPYQIIERYKKVIEKKAKETIIDTFADILQDNLEFAVEKARYVAAFVGYLGATLSANPEICQKASPITYVRPDAPPILTIHGDKDNTILVEEALLLDRKMREVGATHMLVIKNGGGHMNFTLDDPVVWDFLQKALKR